jgi:alkylation response protein AidB-like acyl-CoA dehydrogenase
MDFSLNNEQRMIQRLAREFAEKELVPKAGKVDEEERFPRENFDKLFELGIMGMITPKEYGGAGCDYVTLVAVMEEIAKGCISTAGCFSVHSTVQSSIISYGSEEQKLRYLPLLTKGGKIGAIALTESNAGSDAASISTSALPDSDGYVINGTKIFITTGGEAGIYIVLAKTDSRKESKGISAFIVEEGTKGLNFGKKERKMGYGGSPTREIIFDNCKVPKENLLGREGEGFKIIMSSLDCGRITVGMIGVGLAQSALDAAIKYSKNRIQFGRPIATFQAIQFMMADMATEIEAARLLCYNAAFLKDNNLPMTKEASMAKMYATDVAMRVTIDAIQIFGGYGYMKDYPVERYMREAKIFQIVEGTNEIQRMIIARHILS